MDAGVTSTWVSAPHACLAFQRRASMPPSLCAAAACRPLHTRLHVQGPCHAADVPDSLPARARSRGRCGRQKGGPRAQSKLAGCGAAARGQAARRAARVRVAAGRRRCAPRAAAPKTL